MAIFREGVKTITGTQINNPLQDGGVYSTISSLNNGLTFVRVTDIVLNEQHDKFNEVGQWNGIGTIFYETIDLKEQSTGYAYPLNSNYKSFPLANEIVIIILVPSKLIEGQEGFANQTYYFNPISVWNHPHHNAYPGTNTYNYLSKEQQNDYDKSGDGYVRRIEDEGTDIELNYKYYSNPSQNTFIEKPDIHPITPFMGDIIFEGRHGQSIRFGSTSLPTPPITLPTSSNDWSNNGTNGDPITIIRNGQSITANDRGWEPIVENINYDLSSIYLTSYQQIANYSIANEEFKSFPTLPIGPSSYINPQIILNSDRIIINSKSDSVFISGQKSIGISSNENINLESLNSINIDSPSIKLGGTSASQAVLLGDKTIDLLNKLITEIINLSTALKFIQKPTDPTQAIIDTGISTPAGTAITNLNNMLGELESLKSNIVKTK
jgi:hypothetical protein